ncbi:BnaC06g06500D [Brassica napus]|uniref:BnaC06g06500D protein n=1 Tax=Brassica napus TaxID=3708 RepID=A0A078ETV1_BRANA|nr:BnaC06g06500D [Brassica napus]
MSSKICLNVKQQTKRLYLFILSRLPLLLILVYRVEWLLFLFLNLLFFTYTPAQGTCPRNALQIGACTNVLNAIDLTLGNPPPPVPPCCSLIAGLADLEAAVCLCTALDVNVLGINVHLPIDISVLFNACSRFAPPSFQCP